MQSLHSFTNAVRLELSRITVPPQGTSRLLSLPIPRLSMRQVFIARMMSARVSGEEDDLFSFSLVGVMKHYERQVRHAY